jgi:hypothetical protein
MIATSGSWQDGPEGDHRMHGDYGKYEAGQVSPMIAGIRDFIRRKPA